MSVKPENPTKLHAEGVAIVLACYRKTKSRAAAAEAAGVHIGTIDKRLRDDPDFRQAFDQAGAMYVQRLAAEAERRAHDGVERQKALGSGDNMVIVTEQHYSDVLLLRLLERHDKRFRKGEVIEHEGKIAAAIGLDSLSPEARRKLREILEEATDVSD